MVGEDEDDEEEVLEWVGIWFSSSSMIMDEELLMRVGSEGGIKYTITSTIPFQTNP